MNNFSIVIPVHNKEKYIHKTLESVLKQSYTNFEVILVNDGSTDLSGQICDDYQAKYKNIKAFHQKNQGVSAARNTGMRLAKNTYVAFLDADDYWDASFLEEMNILINTHPGNYIYVAKFACIKNNIAIRNETFFDEQQEYLEFNLIEEFYHKSRLPMHTSSVVINKEVVNLVGDFDTRIIVFEDYDFFLRIALVSNVGYLNKGPFSYYNIDVPADSKARGKLPLLSKNWISYMDKFDKNSQENPKLKLLLDQMKLNQMIAYRRSSQYKTEVKSILNSIDKKSFGWKYKIIFKLPVFLGDFLLKIYAYIVKLKNN